MAAFAMPTTHTFSAGYIANVCELFGFVAVGILPLFVRRFFAPAESQF